MSIIKIFENKSNRVKGLAFHPHRPWIIASLHNGQIQLWNYRMDGGVMIDVFEEHDGPVRGVDFHTTQPIFVSGGDDYKIRLWNYADRRCLFTLNGHLDYIRTVQFHKEYPWIVSASDDQTIRIWNWQNRKCLTVLTGHNHYVMCAQFHPTEDLVLSASLDQTVRVWDIQGLRKKNVSIQEDSHKSAAADMFGTSDVVVKYVLEGHQRGVNWATFHPTQPLIVSGADDRDVKLWRYDHSRAWEVDQMRGHTNNVSCALFHRHRDLIISNSEDKTIRIWNMNDNVPPARSVKRDTDRYWILAAHPELNLFAAGHDSGMLVFKLERERPSFYLHQTAKSAAAYLFYYKEKNIRIKELKKKGSSPEYPIISLNRGVRGRHTFGGHANNTIENPRALMYNSYNPSQHSFLLFSEDDGGKYELFNIEKGNQQIQMQAGLTDKGICVAFTTRNRFAVLQRGHKISLCNLNNEVKRDIPVPDDVSYIFPAGIGKLLLRCAERVILYDTSTRKEISKLTIQSRNPIKFVYWSHDYKLVAMLSKFSLIIADDKLNEMCVINEGIKLKSGVWDRNGVFLYTTSNHLKYCLTTGDHGIIKTLPAPIYLVRAAGCNITYLNRSWDLQEIVVDNTEYLFKLALTKRRFSDVQKIIRTRHLPGEAIIRYLKKRGFPKVALKFVTDLKTRFALALECGDISVAKECADEINSNECWQQLADAALKVGKYKIVKEAYAHMKSLERLSFLFAISGNHKNLAFMLEISQSHKHKTPDKNKMARFNTSLYLGNVEERVEVLEEAGQIGLAYLTARTHGLHEMQEKLAEKYPDDIPDEATLGQVEGKLIYPPAPILPGDIDIKNFEYFDWPSHPIPQEEYLMDRNETDEVDAEQEAAQEANEDEDEWEDSADGAKNKDDIFGSGDDSEAPKARKDQDEEDDADDVWDLGDDDVGDDDDVEEEVDDDTGLGDVAFREGDRPDQAWLDNPNKVPADLVAAGDYNMAMETLRRQFGIVNFEPLRPIFKKIHNAAFAWFTGVNGLAPLEGVVLRTEDPSARYTFPALCVTIGTCMEYRAQAFACKNSGDLEGCIDNFRAMLHHIPFIPILTKEQLHEARRMVDQGREYINACRLKIKSKELFKEDPDSLEGIALLCLYTHFTLEPVHVVFGLKDAIEQLYKRKTFRTCAILVRRLLEVGISSQLPDNAKKLVRKLKQKNFLKKCEAKDTDALELNYNPRGVFDICAMSFSAIPKSDPSVKDPFTGSTFLSQYNGELSPVCELVLIGATARGVQFSSGNIR